MKKTLLSISWFLGCAFSIQAQTLYGTTFFGGKDGGGTINKFSIAIDSLIVPKSFESPPSSPTYTNFIQAIDGKLYGMTWMGGSKNSGVILSFDPSTSTYKKLFDFDPITGGSPVGSLMQASDGKLYGMTMAGGTNLGPSTIGNGVIFSFDPVTLTYKELRNFDYTKDGGNPSGSLIQGSDGKLYGMTSYGGPKAGGVIFSFDLSSSSFTMLKDFDYGDGYLPMGSLMQASDGKLYGMTSHGGASLVGTIFSFDLSNSDYKKLKDFDLAGSGAYPYGSLIQASNGKLYGVAYSGVTSEKYGTIFSFDPSSSIFKKLRNFDKANGTYPSGTLVQAKDGKLYGMTQQGGSKDVGVIFSFDPSSSTYRKVQDFDWINGGYPLGGLMQASNGRLYGMTSHGGIALNDGVIFSLDPSTSAYTVLNDFNTNENGRNVSGNLVQVGDSILYGVTLNGGSMGAGVAFSFKPSKSAYTKLIDFDSSRGALPYGGLMHASNGDLYGMTSDGGSNKAGVIFSINPSNFAYTKLMDFDVTNGARPIGKLIQASDKKLYGMTSRGGNNERGVIFSFDPSTATFKKLKDFDKINGAYPFGGLVQASDGKLYGMTSTGGTYGVGVIFSFDPITSIYTKLKDLDVVNGAFDITKVGASFGDLVQSSDEKLYGMTSAGGSKGVGVIFSFDPSSSTYTKIKDFDKTDGANPSTSLMQASDGKLYGMTSAGGTHDLGVIFSFDPSNSTYTKLKDYTGTNGSQPQFGSGFVEVNEYPTVTVTTPANDTTCTANGVTKIKLNAEASDDGTIRKVEFYNGDTLLHIEYVAPYGYMWQNVQVGSYTITAEATDNGGHITTSAVVHISVVPDIAPTVTITSPANGATYPAYSGITVSADANDVDGIIKKVDFYNGNSLIFTETLAPYERKGYRLREGNYSITAKATDNNGKVTTSQPVVISVVPDIAPVVSINSPANNTTYVAPVTIILSADASDVDGTIRKVDFYKGSTLLFTQNDAPYFKAWFHVAEGNYSITAKATDNSGKVTTSAPITISVISAAKSLMKGGNLNSSKEPLSLDVNPNPVASILKISVHGLQANNKSAISILSISGAVIKTIQPGDLNKNVQLDVSSLSGGVYFIKVISGDKVLYKQFVKL